MKPGPKPKPTALRILAGNPSHRPLNENEPKPGLKIPPCPPHIQGEARREWRRMGRELLRLGLITAIDRSAFAGYCQAWQRWIEAEENIRKTGTVVKAPSGYPIQNPYLSVANKALDQMRAILPEFGMTPASRSRIYVAKEQKQDESEDAKFFKRPKSA